MTTPTTIKAEYLRAVAAEAALDARIDKEVAARVAGDTAIVDRLVAVEARLDALENMPVPVPSPPSPGPAPDWWADLPGWHNVFHDDFAGRTVVAGDFIKGGTVVRWTAPDGSTRTAGTRTADGRYLAFGQSPTDNWPDTSRHGTYAYSNVLSIHDGKLDEAWWADANGYSHTCVITPLPAGGSPRGGLVGARSLVRIWADNAAPGIKIVCLFWGDDAVDNNMLDRGEIDGPEASLNAALKAYLHFAPASSPSDQAVVAYPAVTFQTPHDFVTEWLPGKSVEWFVDGTSIGKVTERVPTAPLHFNIQVESSTDGQRPAANSRGHVYIPRIALWSPA